MVTFQDTVCWPRPLTRTANIVLTKDRMGKMFINHLFWNCLANWNQTWTEWSLGGPLSAIVLDDPARHPRLPTEFKKRTLWEKCFKIFGLTAYLIGTKLWWNGPKIVTFRIISHYSNRQPWLLPAVDIVLTYKLMGKMLQLLGQLEPNYDGIVLRWFSFRLFMGLPQPKT